MSDYTESFYNAANGMSTEEAKSLVDIGPPGTVAGPFGMSAPTPTPGVNPMPEFGGKKGGKGGYQPPIDMSTLPPWAVNVHMAQGMGHPHGNGYGPPGMHPHGMMDPMMGMMGGGPPWMGGMGGPPGMFPRRTAPMIEGTKLFVGNLPLDTTEEELRSVFGTYGQLNAVMLLDSKSKSGMKCAFVFFADMEKASAAVAVMNGNYKFGDSDEAVSVQFARSDDRRFGGKGGGFGGGGFGSRKGGSSYGKGDDWGSGMKGGYEQQPQPGYGPGFQYPTTPQPAAKPSQYHEKPDVPITRNAAINGGGKPSEMPMEKKPPGTATKLFVGNLPHDIDEAAMNTVFGSYGSLQCIFIMHGGSSSQQACAFVEYNTEYEAKTAINTLDGKYEIRPGEGPITVREASKSSKTTAPRAAPY